jgi:putative transposase
MLKVVHDDAEPNEASGSVLDEIVREAARQMLVVALQAEVSAYIDAHAEEVDENGHRLVVRNGHHNEREVITAAGPVPVRAPRVNHKRTDPATGERNGSLRRSCPRGHEVAAGGRGAAAAVPARPVQLGFRSSVDAVAGHQPRLSAATITRLIKDWQDGGDDVQQAVAGRDRLRLLLGRRDPPQGPAGAGQSVPAGDDRGPRGRHQGTHRA